MMILTTMMMMTRIAVLIDGPSLPPFVAAESKLRHPNLKGGGGPSDGWRKKNKHDVIRQATSCHVIDNALRQQQTIS